MICLDIWQKAYFFTSFIVLDLLVNDTSVEFFLKKYLLKLFNLRHGNSNRRTLHADSCGTGSC